MVDLGEELCHRSVLEQTIDQMRQLRLKRKAYILGRTLSFYGSPARGRGDRM